jgi:hypothetical protein
VVAFGSGAEGVLMLCVSYFSMILDSLTFFKSVEICMIFFSLRESYF